jgi:Kef-type K+ transport system membrane component KefB
MTIPQLAVHFFFQVVVILLVCQLVGAIGRRLGQPQVVAEMLAGVILGPSLLGLFFPEIFGKLFPADSMRVLFPVSQFGLALYMFVVGMEFRSDLLRHCLRSVVAVSLAGMAVPTMAGALLGWFLLRQTNLFPAQSTMFEGMAFLGAAMCITAFPMLARIVQHQKLGGTTIGTVALGAGAIDDAAAWGLLAMVLASLDGNYGHALMNLAGGVAYTLIVLLVLRPWLARRARDVEARGSLSESEFVFCLVLLALGAGFTEAIGIHAVFGGFIMGAAMPRGLVRKTLIERIQPLTTALLLPLFFAYSGLNTQIGLLNSGHLWAMSVLILIVAVGGKVVGCWLAARATGFSHREGLGIGVLMNTRGLMELVIINIGLQRGIISPALFTILVVMAVVTTLMASPVFELLLGGHRKPTTPNPAARLAVHEVHRD